jgi:hypothetical protein
MDIKKNINAGHSKLQYLKAHIEGIWIDLLIKNYCCTVLRDMMDNFSSM